MKKAIFVNGFKFIEDSKSSYTCYPCISGIESVSVVKVQDLDTGSYLWCVRMAYTQELPMKISSLIYKIQGESFEKVAFPLVKILQVMKEYSSNLYDSLQKIVTELK